MQRSHVSNKLRTGFFFHFKSFRLSFLTRILIWLVEKEYNVLSETLFHLIICYDPVERKLYGNPKYFKRTCFGDKNLTTWVLCTLWNIIIFKYSFNECSLLVSTSININVWRVIKIWHTIIVVDLGLSLYYWKTNKRNFTLMYCFPSFNWEVT